MNRNSNNSHNIKNTNPRSTSETPSPPIPPIRTSSNVTATAPLLNGHLQDDEIQRITIEDNRSKFAIYSIPNKARKVSTEKKISTEVTPMALSKVMPLLISNGHHQEDETEEHNNHYNEENNTTNSSNGLPPQYPNRIGKSPGHKLKASNNYSAAGYQHYNGSHDYPAASNGAMDENVGSSSVPRRHKRRGKKSVNDTSCVDSDLEHHILYGKETTL